MKKTGIWIDQKEANVITLIGDIVKNKTIYSDIETRERFEGESKAFGRFGDQYLNNEKSKKNKINDLTTKYLNSIIKEVEQTDEILIFGPAQTKIKLENLIHNNTKISAKLKEVQKAENMTENQKVAYVKKFFDN